MIKNVFSLNIMKYLANKYLYSKQFYKTFYNCKKKIKKNF